MPRYIFICFFQQMGIIVRNVWFINVHILFFETFINYDYEIRFCRCYLISGFDSALYVKKCLSKQEKYLKFVSL